MLIGQERSSLQFNFHYGVDMPFGEIGKRYGINYNPGIDIEFTINKKQFIGIHGHYILGTDVKIDPTEVLRNSDGLLVTQLETAADIGLRQRGNLLGVHWGSLLLKKNKKYSHGIRLKFGVGIYTNYIIFNDESNATVQLSGQYSLGYDRLHRGVCLQQFVGYQYISSSKLMNIHIGFNIVEGMSKSLRPIDFDTGFYGGNKKIDILCGLKVGMTFTLFDFSDGEEIFY